MKALVLDPDPGRREAVAAVLSRENRPVTVVDSAEDLIASRRAERHGLVFVAAEILLREGPRLTQQLRFPGGLGDCAVFAVGGPPREGSLRDLLAAGVDDVLCEPIHEQQMAIRVEVAERRLRRGLRRERWFESLIAFAFISISLAVAAVPRWIVMVARRPGNKAQRPRSSRFGISASTR